MAMGTMKLMGVDVLVQNFQRWGYPGWFLYVIGAVEVMGALGLVFERVRFQAAMILALAWSARSGCVLLSRTNKHSSSAA